MAEPSGSRIWEIDLVRGICIVMMVAFHLVVDLREFYHQPLEYQSGFWFYLGRVTVAVFMFIAGVSSVLNRRIIRHGLTVLAAGCLITAATRIFTPDLYVRFGILQFMGVAILSVPVMGKLSSIWLVVAALLVLLAGQAIQGLTGHWLLLPLGIMYEGYRSFDYYPLIPWYSVFLLGMVAGRLFYAEKKGKISPITGLNWLARIGRHSLSIYLVHQPVLLALLYFFFI
ncbi:heparan-alpha-glucosaminide N-acetyltransferase [Acetonema longum]|uniref:heparan-alpha-glucosaminide N-acetyltransferase n=1 Tax=Acetonema longum TaxID=2374 RepID=UPI00031CCC55|nr:heparan-alpha-glucosaminide N-acetyltransferase [Acetonema longum]